MSLIIEGILDTFMKHMCALYLFVAWSLLLYYMNFSIIRNVRKKEASGIRAYENDNSSNVNFNMISLPNKDYSSTITFRLRPLP